MSEELIIEEGVSPADIALAQKLHEESQNEIPPETTLEDSGVEVVQDDKVDQTEDKQSQQDKSTDTHELTFKVKGEEKVYTHEQIQHLLSRDQTFQQKYETLRNSDEYKELLALRAAKEGDKGARKLILEQLKGMEDDLESLAEVEEEFDVNAKDADSKMEEAFADVKSEVDYEDTMTKITDLKSKIPEKVWQSYYDSPDTRRTMYDLIKSGRDSEILEGVNQAISELPLGERVKAKADPEFYGMLVVEVVNDLNAQRASSDGTKDLGEPSELDAVSTGKSSRSVAQEEEPIDWMKLYETNPAKFKEMERKLLGRNF